MRGHTLVELLFVLLLVAVGTSSLAPAARRQRDRAAVVAAREAVVALFTQARLAAVERGGASVRISSGPWRGEARAGTSTLRAVALATDFGVGVRLSGGRTDVELHYDALGLGRVASQTIGFSRGGASTELIVSSYGRVRRR